MEKRMDRLRLNDDLLDQVSGGFEGPERASFQAYCEEKMEEKMRESDIITTVPDLDNPHSKKQKGMLYK